MQQPMPCRRRVNRRGDGLPEKGGGIPTRLRAGAYPHGRNSAATGQAGTGYPELEQAKKLGAPSPTIDFLLISSYLAAKDFDRALTALQPLQEKEAQNAAMWNLTGIAYAGKGQLDKAQEAWRKALEVNPGDPGTTTNLARLALAQKDPATARRYYQQALAKHPDELQLLLGLAELERQQGDKAAYIKQLDEAIQRQPKALQPRLLRAGAYLQENNPSKARGLLVEVQEAYGSDPASCCCWVIPI